MIKIGACFLGSKRGEKGPQKQRDFLGTKSSLVTDVLKDMQLGCTKVGHKGRPTRRMAG